MYADDLTPPPLLWSSISYKGRGGTKSCKMPAARKPPSSRCTVISGIFQIEYRSENEANGDSDDDDDEENDPWLDFEEMEESSVPVQSCIPKMNKGT